MFPHSCTSSLISRFIIVVITVCAVSADVVDDNGDVGQDDVDVGVPVPFSVDELTRIVDDHNQARGNVTPAAANMEYMYWDDDLASAADGWAIRCTMKHGLPPNSTITRFGQNIWAGYAISRRFVPDVASSIRAWNTEDRFYDYETNTCEDGRQCGHYTQVIWASTDRVGCGRAFCPVDDNFPFNRWLVVCNYLPGGNIRGRQPYSEGTSCTKCASGIGQCYRNKCRPCSEHTDPCECNLQCQNCGTLDVTTCKCACPRGWHGSECGKPCVDTHDYCGRSPGWPGRFFCGYADYIPRYCPLMCGVCEPRDPDFVCGEELEGTTAIYPYNQTKESTTAITSRSDLTTNTPSPATTTPATTTPHTRTASTSSLTSITTGSTAAKPTTATTIQAATTPTVATTGIHTTTTAATPDVAITVATTVPVTATPTVATTATNIAATTVQVNATPTVATTDPTKAATIADTTGATSATPTVATTVATTSTTTLSTSAFTTTATTAASTTAGIINNLTTTASLAPFATTTDLTHTTTVAATTTTNHPSPRTTSASITSMLFNSGTGSEALPASNPPRGNARTEHVKEITSDPPQTNKYLVAPIAELKSDEKRVNFAALTSRDRETADGIPSNENVLQDPSLQSPSITLDSDSAILTVAHPVTDMSNLASNETTEADMPVTQETNLLMTPLLDTASKTELHRQPSAVNMSTSQSNASTTSSSLSTASSDDVVTVSNQISMATLPGRNDHEAITRTLSPSSIPKGILCGNTFTAAAALGQILFLFRGKDLWRFNASSGEVLGWREQETVSTYFGLEGQKVTAAYYRKAADEWVLFTYFHVFFIRNATTESHPIVKNHVRLRTFDIGIPFGVIVDAAFHDERRKKSYLFTDRWVWRYDDERGRVDVRYPKRSRFEFPKLMPYRPTAALTLNGFHYVLFGKKYARIHQATHRVNALRGENFLEDLLGCIP